VLSAIEIPENRVKHCDIYTDGGARPSRGKGGWGYWGHDENGTTYSGLGYVGDMVTNNRAELTGFIRAMETALHLRWQSLHIYSDSQYVLKGSKSFIKGWLRNGWVNAKGEPVSNKDLWLEIIALKKKLKEEGIKFKTSKVKAHSGVYGNEMADANATRAIERGSQGETGETLDIVFKEDEVRKLKPCDCNKLIYGKTILYTTRVSNVLEDGRTSYLLNSFSGKFEEGVRTGLLAAESVYGCVLTKTPVTALDVLRDRQDIVTPSDFVHPASILLANVVKPAVWDDLKENGTLHIVARRLNLTTADDIMLTYFHKPARHAMRGRQYATVVKARLLDLSSGNNGNMTRIDITDEIFKPVPSVPETNGKKSKKKVKKPVRALVPSVRKQNHCKVNVPHGKLTIPVVLTWGHDIPPVNNLSALGKTNPELKVEVIKYEEGKDSFRYAIYIETNDSTALYAAASNLRVA